MCVCVSVCVFIFVLVIFNGVMALADPDLVPATPVTSLIELI